MVWYMTMEFVDQPYMPFPDPRLELTLVNEYLHQLGEPRLRDVWDAHEIFDEQRLAIETILSTEKGRDALLPHLARQSNKSEAKLSGRRAHAAERLAVLFDPKVTLETVAKSQNATLYAVRTMLMGIFRRSAVVGISNPELLDEALISFDKKTLWRTPAAPAAAPSILRAASQPSLSLAQGSAPDILEPIALAGVSGEIKTRLEYALETLHASEREALILFLGLDGQGRRTYKEIARRLECTFSSVQKRMWITTKRLKESGNIALVNEYIEAMQQQEG